MPDPRPIPGRWVRICGDCWYELFPTEYAPTSSDYDDCYRCGELGLTYGVNPSALSLLRSGRHPRGPEVHGSRE